MRKFVGIWGFGVVITILLVIISINLHINDDIDVNIILRRLKQIEWGGFFGGSALSNGRFPKMDCNFLGKDLCCSALENVEKKVPKVKHLTPHTHCTITKEYFPSPYEIRHLAKAEEIAKLPELKDRTVMFINFIETPEEIEHATKWLDRVAIRQPGTIVEENDVDREYLSRFKVTRKCPNMADHSWWEYIEPLSVHARHPFGLSECWHPHYRDKINVYNKKSPHASLLSVDFILLQSKNDLNGHGNSSLLRNAHPIPPPPNVFLLDGGTSRFDSSLYWFVCAYQQVYFILLIVLFDLARVCLGSNIWLGIHAPRTRGFLGSCSSPIYWTISLLQCSNISRSDISAFSHSVD